MSLPYLGLGLSTNAQVTDVPHPYRLLDASPGAFDFVEYSAPLELTQAHAEATLFAQMLERRAEVPLLYHPVHINLWGPVVEAPDRLKALAEHVAAVSSPWVSNDVGWWHQGDAALPGYLYLAPPLNAEGVAGATMHVAALRDAMTVPVLLENPVVMTARGELHVLDFMERLSTATHCNLLLDVGHLYSHQLARGLSLTEGLGSFPFERVVEVHIAGGVVTSRGARKIYIDDHPQPIRDEVWALLEHVLPRCTSLRALTYEGDGHPDAVASLNLKRMRSLLLGGAETTSPPDLPKAEASARLEPARAWQTFDDVHRGHCPEDPVGATAELDFRLAVLAQTLDAAVPLTRLAVAATREPLARFIASESVRDWFEQGTRDIVDVFVAWALREARNEALQGAEALVSLEAWARHTARRLASGSTMSAVFPVCLTEAVHAAKSVHRHLTARGWWSDTGLESSGLDAVLQAARRSAPGPWAVTLRRLGAKIEVLEP